MEVFALQIVVLAIVTHCDGLGTSAIFVENDVGVLSLFQPTFVGRNVTFKFTPSSRIALDDVRWTYVKKDSSQNTRIADDNKNFLLHDDGKSSVLVLPDVDWSFNGSTIYTSIDHKGHSDLLELILKNYTDANSCGELYLLLEGPFIAGDNVSFAYFSSPLVAKENMSSKYFLELIKGNAKDQTPVPLQNGVLEVYQQNYELVFTLLNVTKTNSGQYWILCSNGLFGSTNSIHLSVKGHPIIGPLTTISTCSDCIVFNTKETLEKVYCETDEEYSALNVKFEIGLNHYAANKLSRNRVGLDSYERPANILHLMNVICTVFVKHREMSVEASIYVVVNPNGPPNLSANEELLEGETVDITCTSSSARPPPLLKFLVEATAIGTNTNVSTIYDDSTGLYTSVSKLYSFKKEWGNKSILCMQFPEVNGLYHETVSTSVYMLYKYPPSRLLLVIDQGTLSKDITASCTSMFSYPACTIKWESTIEHFKYTLLQNRTFNQTTLSRISFNVTREEFGKQIRCRAECEYFKNALLNTTTVIFAKKPKVVIHSTSTLNAQPNTHITLICAANAHPIGNITWTMANASNSYFSPTKSCLYASTCNYEMTTTDVEQEFLCFATNDYGSDRGSILVTVQEQSKTGSFVWIIVSLIAVVTLGVILLVLFGCRKHWHRVYEALHIHQNVRHTYQGTAVFFTNRSPEPDEMQSPRVYDEIDENNSPTVHAGANITTHERGNTQWQRENSNMYDTITETITQVTEMTRDHPEANNPGSVKGETNTEGGEGYLHVIYK